MTNSLFSRLFRVRDAAQGAGGKASSARSAKKVSLPVDSPESLAGVLINGFDAALYAIPKALYVSLTDAVAESEDARAERVKFLKRTVEILVEAGGEEGFRARRSLVELFIKLAEAPGPDSLYALCTFVSKGSGELRSTLAWDGRASKALDTLKLCRGLTPQRLKENEVWKLKKEAKRPPPKGTALAGDVQEMEISKEWSKLWEFLSNWLTSSNNDKKKDEIRLANDMNQILNKRVYLWPLGQSIKKSIEVAQSQEPDSVGKVGPKQGGNSHKGRR